MRTSLLFLFISLWLALSWQQSTPRIIASSVGFETTVVTTTDDELVVDGDCSLREAIHAVNIRASYDQCGHNPIIELQANALYQLNGTQLTVNEVDFVGYTGPLEIHGMDATIDAGNLSRIFNCNKCSLYLADLTLRNGSATNGGAIFITDPTPEQERSIRISLNQTSLLNNHASSNGGAIYCAVECDMYINGDVTKKPVDTDRTTEIKGNTAAKDGGAIWLGGTSRLIVDLNVNLDSNHADRGGAIYFESEHDHSFSVSLALRNSSLSGNSARKGGALFVNRSVGRDLSMYTMNTTFYNNSATADGGAIWSNFPLVFANVTVAGNSADSDGDGSGNGGGFFANGSGVTARNSIIAGNRDLSPTNRAPDCRGTFTSEGYNLLGDDDSCTYVANGQPGDHVGTTTTIDPKLYVVHDADSNQIGLPPTSSSVARNGGNPDGCDNPWGDTLTHDQFDRERVDRCDMGAVEGGLESPPLAVSLSEPQTSGRPQLATVAFTLLLASTLGTLIWRRTASDHA